jgi:hypothetical protein
METASSSEMFNAYQTTWRHIPEHSNLHTLKVFENRLLRRVFGPKREEETGGWRKLRNEELHNLYSSPDIISVIKSISLYSSEIVDKKEIFGEVGTVYLV